MQPKIRSVTPILPVEDIRATLAYYRDVIGATDTWDWGDPPNHGGCSLGSAHVHFTLNPSLCQSSRGLSMFVNVLDIETLYQRQQEAGAVILSQMEPKPWGVKEYTLEDCNGVQLRFAQGGFTSERGEPLEGVVITPRKQTIKELRDLLIAVHWQFDDTEKALDETINDPIYTVVAEYEGRCIASAGVLGHQTGHYLVFNVMVHPDYQSRGVGKQMMRAIDDWLIANGIPGAMVKLFTGLDRQPFYQQFGFVGSEMGLIGMTKTLPKLPQ